MKPFFKLLSLLSLLLLLICSGALRAQKNSTGPVKRGQARMDSLLAELSSPAYADEDTDKVKLLNVISFDYRVIMPDEGLKYGQQALQMSSRLEWKRGMATAYNALGNNYQNKSDNKKALECYLSALKINEETGYKLGCAAVSGNIGIVYVHLADYARAVEYNIKALKINEELGNKSSMANNLVTIGIIYQYQSDYVKSLEYYFKASKVYEEAGSKSGLASVTGDIGIIYANQKDFPKALEHFTKAVALNEELGNKTDLARMTGNIGALYADQGDNPLALVYHFKAMKMHEEIGDRKGLAIAMGDIGSVFLREKNYTMAIEYQQAALKIDQETGDKNGIAWKLNNLGEAYVMFVKDSLRGKSAQTTRGQAPELELPSAKYRGTIPTSRAACLQRAIDYLRQALDIGREIKAPAIAKKAYKNLSEASRLNGDYKNALEYRERYSAINDSIFSKENSEKILKLSLQNEYERKHLADSLKADEQQQLTSIEIQRQRGYTYMGVAGIVLLLAFSFFIVKERSVSEVERKKSDALLLNILPEEVAEELKMHGTTTARHFDDVTVLFTDFVNFSTAAETLSPQLLIDELHTCFKAFDEITHKYNIEKIKTIGDAYLAVCGLPAPDPQHAEQVVKAAKEINAFMQDRVAKLGQRTFEIRIGIHSGSVVAGIVGVKKFAYDIWGDTVNTAARVEQHGEAGKINISGSTYELVKDKFHCEYRGEIAAKNKGAMKMYFVS